MFLLNLEFNMTIYEVLLKIRGTYCGPITSPLASHENTPLLRLAPVSSSNLMLMLREKLQQCDSGQKITIMCQSIIFFSPSGSTPPPQPRVTEQQAGPPLEKV
jgi:hypothetical protein